MDFDTLPNELLLAIFSEVSQIKPIISISRVSKSWRRVSFDPALWKKFYQRYYPLDPLVPSDNQWYLAFVNKHKLFQAMRHDNVTIRSLFSKEKLLDALQDLSFSTEVSLFKDTVVVTPQTYSRGDGYNYYKELGCHLINFRTEEMRILSHEYYVKVYGDYTALIDLAQKDQSIKMTVIKTPNTLEDINESDVIRNEYELANTREWIWNRDLKTPSMLYKEDQDNYFFNWSTGERHPLLNFKRGMLYKDLIIELIDDKTARVIKDSIELHRYDFEHKIEAVCTNENLIAFAIARDEVVHIFDMKTDQRTSLKIPHLTPHEHSVRERLGGTLRGAIKPRLYLFDDILVITLHSLIYFYDINRTKELLKISLQLRWPVHHVLRASSTEFICRAGLNILVIRIEVDPNPIKILKMPPKSDITKLSINGSKFNAEVLALDHTPFLKSFYFVNNDRQRFGVIYNINSEEEVNTRAMELFTILPNKERITSIVHFKCKRSTIPSKEHEQSKPIRGPAIIFCEQFMNDRWQYATPEQWPDVIIDFQLNINK